MIRRAGAEDVDEIARVFGRSFGSLTFLPQLHSPEEHRAFFARVVADGEVWAWEEDGALVGFAAVGDTHLDHIYVEPDRTGHGIGSALLAHVKSRRPQGFDLWTFQDNAGARRFYDRHGFRAVELTDGSGNEERMPDVRYVWP
jgi:ribosomal protein S18 acetylase RimI-like enzyme